MQPRIHAFTNESNIVEEHIVNFWCNDNMFCLGRVSSHKSAKLLPLFHAQDSYIHE